MHQEFRAIDAHVAGTPVRLLVGGVPRLSGTTLRKRRNWLLRRADHVRRAAVLEPRGHRDLVGVLLTEPVSNGADAGLLFLDAGGYPFLHGAAVVAAATIAIERGLITKGRRDGEERGSEIVHLEFDTPAGSVVAEAEIVNVQAGARVRSVRLTGVPAFVTHAGLEMRLGTRRLRADLAYGGAFYAIVDSEAIGIPLVPDRLADVRRLGVEICTALDGHEALVHPDDPDRNGIGGAIFTGPPQSSDAHLRSVTISRDGGCDRSPGMTGAAAVMAVLHAMGLLQEGDDFVHEGLLGLPERGRVVRSALVGDMPAIVPEATGAAWITGEHTLIVDEADPLREGFSL